MFSKTFLHFRISRNHLYQIWQLVVFSIYISIYQDIITSQLFKLHFHIKICRYITYLYIFRHLTDHQIWWPHYSIFNSSSTVLRVWSHSISHHVKGSFFNYVDQILPIIDHLPTALLVDIVKWIPLYIVIRKNMHNIVDISSTT